MKIAIINVFVLLFICERFVPISSSLGDRSVVYQSCVNRCVQDNCTNGTYLMRAYPSFLRSESMLERDLDCSYSRYN